MAKKVIVEPLFLKICGLKILDVKGYKPPVGKRVEPTFIFFDDKKLISNWKNKTLMIIMIVLILLD